MQRFCFFVVDLYYYISFIGHSLRFLISGLIDLLPACLPWNVYLDGFEIEDYESKAGSIIYSTVMSNISTGFMTIEAIINPDKKQYSTR